MLDKFLKKNGCRTTVGLMVSDHKTTGSFHKSIEKYFQKWAEKTLVVEPTGRWQKYSNACTDMADGKVVNYKDLAIYNLYVNATPIPNPKSTQDRLFNSEYSILEKCFEEYERHVVDHLRNKGMRDDLINGRALSKAQQKDIFYLWLGRYGNTPSGQIDQYWLELNERETAF